MTLRDTTVAESDAPDHVWPFAAPLPEPAAPTRRARRARVNYRSADRPGTARRHAAILELLAMAPVGFTVRDVGAALGVSRQLALYHLKKLAAKGLLTMMLEPCERNGGLQFAVWDTSRLRAAFAAGAVGQRRAA